MSSLLVVNSMTGNTKTFIGFFKEHSDIDVVVCEDFSESIKDYDKIAIGSYSWGGRGRIPAKMKEYLIGHKDDFKNKDLFVFGSGNSIYRFFCGAVDGMTKIVTDCGANVKGVFKFEQRFNLDDFSDDELMQLVRMIKDWSK